MDRAAVADTLRAWALEAGFHRAGVARVEPSAHGDAYVRWLENGEHAAMGYLARRVAERLDPRRLMPDARTALCVALRYAPLIEARPGRDEAEVQGRRGAMPRSDQHTADENDLWPRVARYAQGRDYHDLMTERLEALRARIEAAHPGAVLRRYVDTGPVLERELAARAGLGAVGKNTCLLSREAGSYFLLGELFLSLDLPPEEPLADLCGSCTLCIEACPTGALPEPRHLDASRCISYWTIEHRGALPPEMREGIGEWVFGCDLCQEVCPWNRRRQDPVDEAELQLPAVRAELDLAALLGLGRDEYVERFRGSAMKRARLDGLQRNAAVAMGNRGDVRYVPSLVAALAESSSPVVRGHAAWALGRIGGAAARAALSRAARCECDPAVCEEVRAALAHAPG